MIDADPSIDGGSAPHHGAPPTPSSPRLRQSVVRPALERLDWTVLQKHLDEIGLDDATLSELLGHVRRCSNLIMPYVDERRERRRVAFIAAFDAHIRRVLGEQAASAAAAEFALLDGIERVYRKILEVLDQCEISRLPADQRAAAYIDRAAAQFTDLIGKVRGAIKRRKEISVLHANLLTREDQTVVSPDGVITALVEGLTITLQMEAHKNGWFDAAGTLILPPLSIVGDDERDKAGSTEVAAAYWRRWRHIEERRRFLGGVFKEHATPDLPAWAPEGAQTVTEYDPPLSEIVDYIANERLADRLNQTLLEMMMETNLEAKATGIRSGAPLLPGALISAVEGHAAVSLSEILSYSVADDTERPGGLRLVEWLRGYAVLNVLAEERAGEAMETPVFTVSHSELVDMLENCGLAGRAAARFIDAVSLNQSSRDLFDSPLIRLADGTLVVFGPGVINTNPARVVLSTLSTLGESLSRKGKAFEQDVLGYLKKRGLQAETITVRREGEEYNYDVVLAWGDYIFLFECKNHSLSNYNAVQAYRCVQEIRSNIKQIKRLADALRRHPDILREGMGVDQEGKTIIPCVLNALPYALPGAVDGVHVFDASALKRFFEDRHFRIKTGYEIAENIKFIHRVAMHSAWAGDKPAPEDLVRQLQVPFQIRLMLAHTEISCRPFRIGTHLIAAGEFHRKEITIESYAKLVSVSAKAIRREQAEVAREVREVKIRLKKRARSPQRPGKRR